MIVVGIDPGLTGAAALVSHNGLLDVFDLPTSSSSDTARVSRKLDGAAFAKTLREALTRNDAGKEDVFIVLEDVHVMPKGNAANASLMHTKGVLEGVLATLGHKVELVGSQKWKKLFGIGSDKTAARRTALTLYPNAPVTLAKHHNRAEAILIARFGLRKML